MQNKKIILPLFAVALLGGAATAGIVSLASAQTTTASTSSTSASDHMGRGVAGTITAVNGDTITLTGKDGTTYTVNAASAKISKTSTIDVTGLSVGDTLMVGGTVNGSSVTATNIMDGAMPTGGMGGDRGPGGFGGKGPGVMGTVTSVSGSTLTVTEKSGTVYTVDATSAKVMKGTAGSKPAASTLSSVAVGDTVGIRGTVTGQNVVATDVMDGVFARGPMGAKGQSGSASSTATTSTTAQ